MYRSLNQTFWLKGMYEYCMGKFFFQTIHIMIFLYP